jgi:hypothetical protein
LPSTAPTLAPHLAQLRLAVVEYRHAIELDPERPEAWFNLGALLLDACTDAVSWNQGREYVRRAADLSAHDPRHAVVVERARQRLRRAADCPPGFWGNAAVCHPLAIRALSPHTVRAPPEFACDALHGDLPLPRMVEARPAMDRHPTWCAPCTLGFARIVYDLDRDRERFID